MISTSIERGLSGPCHVQRQLSEEPASTRLAAEPPVQCLLRLRAALEGHAALLPHEASR